MTILISILLILFFVETEKKSFILGKFKNSTKYERDI